MTKPNCSEEDKQNLLHGLTDHICARTVCGSCRVEALMEVLSAEICCVYPEANVETMMMTFGSFIDKNRPIVTQQLRKRMN